MNRQRFQYGAILAGGAGLRLGGPKEGLLLADGRPMIAHVLQPLSEVCEQIVVVGGCRGLPSHILHLPDRHPGRGPMGGLETLLASGLGAGYLVTACDQPLLTPDLLRLLLGGDATRPRLFEPPNPHTHPNGTGKVRVDPFPGYFPAHLLRRVRAALASGDASMQRLIGGLTRSKTPVSWVPLPASFRSALRSVNTPEDLRALYPAPQTDGCAQ